MTPTYNHNALPTTSPIGAFGVHIGLHSLVVSPVGAILNQRIRKSSPLTKDGKPPRNEKDEGEDLEKTGESRKRPGTCLLDIKIDQGTHSRLGVSWVWALSFLSLPHPEPPSSISQHERDKLLCGCSPLCCSRQHIH